MPDQVLEAPPTAVMPMGPIPALTLMQPCTTKILVIKITAQCIQPWILWVFELWPKISYYQNGQIIFKNRDIAILLKLFYQILAANQQHQLLYTYSYVYNK